MYGRALCLTERVFVDMAYDILIEKRAGADNGHLLLSRHLSMRGIDGEISGVSTLLRISGIRAEQVETLVNELSCDASVKVSFSESCDQRREGSIVLSGRNGVFSPATDVAYRILMLKFPRIASTLRIKEYTVFTLESNLDNDVVQAIRDTLIGMGRCRYVDDSELLPLEEKTGSVAKYSPKRARCSIASKENPDLSEPFSTVSLRMVMNAYANRTYEDMKNTSTLTVRSGERTVYLDAEYTALEEKLREIDLVMDIDDASAAQSYFLSESREPTEMELRIISRCRSEHWAHPALNTSIKISSCDDPNVAETVRKYDEESMERGWDIEERSTLAELIFDPIERFYEEDRASGHIATPVRIDGERNGLRILSDNGEKVLIFNLESNNSKTSVNPADGATSCLGSALRRAMRMNAVPYEVMRLSGIASPFASDEDGDGSDVDAVEQGRLAREALDSFSGYARTVGIPCSANYEYVSDRFSCKHMEVSGVLSVSDNPVNGVEPCAGDFVLIFGNRTGRDGRVYRKYLNATEEIVADELKKAKNAADSLGDGSAERDSEVKAATAVGKVADGLLSQAQIAEKERFILENGETVLGESISGGNALMQKKLMRICADREFKGAVKRIREVDSSGLVTAVAAIATGVELYLDCVPVKYNGMYDTDVAFSETCERMIAVVGRDDAARVIEICASYGVICTCIGVVTSDGQLSVYGGGKRIAYVSTDFLMRSGSERSIEAKVSLPQRLPEGEALKLALRPIEDATAFQRLFIKPTADHFAACEYIARNCKLGTEARQRRFDSTVTETTGINHMIRPYAPVAVSYIKDKNEVMTKDGEKLCSALSIGLHTDICDVDPFKGAYYAMTDAICRLVAAGASHKTAYTAVQMFHPTYKKDLERTGDTLAAAAGAYRAQRALGTPAICGDFSLGGAASEKHRPAVAVFGITVGREQDFRNSGFKAVGNRLAVFKPVMDKNGLPEPDSQIEIFERVEKMLREKKAYSAIALTGMSLAEGVMHMCNGADGEFGFEFDDDCTPEEMYGNLYGAIAVEVACSSELPRGVTFGTVTPSREISARHKTVDKSSEGAAEERDETENGHATVDNGEIAISLDYLEEISAKKNLTVYENTPFPEVMGEMSFMARSASAVASDAPKYPLSSSAFRRGGSPVSILVPRFNGSLGAESLIKALVSASNSKVEIVPFDCSINSETAEELAKRILRSGAVFIPDFAESPQLLSSLLRCTNVANAVARLRKAGGLIYGCGAAFEALIEAGYIGGTENYGSIEGLAVAKNPLSGLTRMPTLVKVNSCRSPFMTLAEGGQIYRTEISSYRGRLIGNMDQLNAASAEGVVPTVYAEDKSATGVYSRFDPCCSALGIDSMTSADGTVLGQLSIPDRACYKAYGELEGYQALPIFRSVIKYLTE